MTGAARTQGATDGRTAPDLHATLELYRDDGPLARALGRAFGGVLRLPPVFLIAAGVLPLLAVIAIERDDASDAVVGAAVAWLVLAGGASSGRPHRDRLRWVVAPGLRLGEYAGLLWLATVAGDSALPAVFALLAVIAFRHYDLIYRFRYQGGPPPRWVGDAGGGWDGRLAAGYVLLLADALPTGFFVLTGVLAALFVGESVASWVRVQRVGALAVYEEEEGEDE
jgi:hypothetical protein